MLYMAPALRQPLMQLLANTGHTTIRYSHYIIIYITTCLSLYLCVSLAVSIITLGNASPLAGLVSWMIRTIGAIIVFIRISLLFSRGAGEGGIQYTGTEARTGYNGYTGWHSGCRTFTQSYYMHSLC